MPRKPKKTKKGSFTTPFTSTELKKYSERLRTDISIKSSNEIAKPKMAAFKITFKDQPDLVFISFQPKELGKATTRARARWSACKYFKDSMHPSFQKRDDCKAELRQTVTKRIHDFDKYGTRGKVPIPELMKHIGATFPCSICGKDNFNFEDYKIGRCFIAEGEGDINPFTDGLILCYNCYKKYINAIL